MDNNYKTKKEGAIVSESFFIDQGMLRDMSNYRFPLRIYGWKSGDMASPLMLKKESTFYGFVYAGEAKIKTVNNEYTLKERQYFCFNNEIKIEGGSGVVIESMSSRGLDMLGGPVENQGRLRYVDGCTDSLLVAPVRFGDPCLNAIFLPAMTDQTAHTHPSVRIVMVLEGEGECVTPEKITSLTPGTVFIVHEEGLHKIRVSENQRMVLIAYHPDSDYGPKDDDHPMINRTVVEGISASERSDIQT